MKTGAAAQRYAKAVFSLGVDTGEFERIGQEIEAVVSALEADATLRDILLNPQYDAAAKRAVVTAISEKKGFCVTSRNFLLLLVDRGRFSLLSEIYRSYQGLSDQKAGRMKATVYTAAKVSDQVVQDIIGSLEKRTGKKVTLTSEIEPNLIGGIVIKVGDIIFDGSIRMQLRKLKGNIEKAI